MRKQGFVGEADPQGRRREQQVLDYPTQMHTLMPLLAWAYALQVRLLVFGTHTEQLYIEEVYIPCGGDDRHRGRRVTWCAMCPIAEVTWMLMMVGLVCPIAEVP